MTETEFIRYNGTYGDNIQGAVGASFSPLRVQSSVTLEGKESSVLQTSFGSLKKEEVDMQKLLRDCKDRQAKDTTQRRPHLRTGTSEACGEPLVYNGFWWSFL